MSRVRLVREGVKKFFERVQDARIYADQSGGLKSVACSVKIRGYYVIVAAQ
jgi:hypothetical protein